MYIFILIKTMFIQLKIASLTKRKNENKFIQKDFQLQLG